jgi:tryptophan synthase alpha chain
MGSCGLEDVDYWADGLLDYWSERHRAHELSSICPLVHQSIIPLFQSMTPLSTNRIDATFAALRTARPAGLIAYIAAGDPSLAATRELALAFEQAGVDILELGVPFSDPLADGIVNQLAAARALAAGATVRGVLDTVRDIRRTSQLPIVLYTYMNPIYRYGFAEFQRDAEAAGVDGLLILDLPPDEDAQNAELTQQSGMKRIRLIAPTTPPARIAKLTADASGFIYYVSREGVTGERSDVVASLGESVAAIRATTPLPISVGFGISTPEQVRTVAKVADAVVVGSAIVKQIAEHGSAPDLVARLAAFIRPLAEATRA